MMVPNTYLLVQEAHVRREQLVAEAVHYRLCTMQRMKTMPIKYRLRHRVGAWFVAVGEWLARDAAAVGHDVRPHTMRTTAS